MSLKDPRPKLQRIAGIVALALQATLLACQNTGQRDARLHSDPTPSSPPEHVSEPSPGGAVTLQGSGAATVDVGGQRMSITLADAQAIKAALLARLRQSQVEHRDYLINATEHIAPSIDQGLVRIGIWVLQAHGDELAITYRMPAGPAAAPTYRAEVAKEGTAWVVKDVVAGQIRVRR